MEGSAAKYMTRYKLLISAQNPTTENNSSLFKTVFHTVKADAAYLLSMQLPCTFFNIRESKAKAYIFPQKHSNTD